jgi:hypothetical protein
VGARLRLAGQPAFTRGAKNSADGLSKLAREAGQADRKVTGLERAAKRTRSALGKVAKGLAFGAIGAAAAGAAGAVAFLTQGVRGASDLSESLSKVQTVFGSASKQVEDFASKAARSLGMTRQETLEAAGTFGNLFSALGIGQKPAADLSNSLVTLATDLGSFNNVSSEEALLALRSGLLGEAEPLRKYGVSLSATRIEAEAVAMGLVKVSKGTKKQKIELTSAQKAQAAYAIIMKDTKKAQGDFARTSGGLANQQKILRAQFENTRTEIGAGLLPVITRLATWTNDNVLPAFQKLADEFARGEGKGGEIRDALEDLGHKARDMGPHLQTAYDKTKQVIDFVIQHRDAFVTITSGVVAYRTAMAGAAAASALMGTNGPKAAAGMTAAGAAASANTAKVATFGTALSRAAGAAGVLAGLYFTNDSVKRELDEVGGGFKKITKGDIWEGVKDVVGVNDMPPAPWNVGKNKGGPLGTRGPEGGRARGGPVTAGFAYRVGEYEPEVFVPRVSGRVVPQSQQMAASGGGGVVVNLHNEFHGYTGGPQDADRIVEVVRRGVRQELARR